MTVAFMLPLLKSATPFWSGQPTTFRLKLITSAFLSLSLLFLTGTTLALIATGRVERHWSKLRLNQIKSIFRYQKKGFPTKQLPRFAGDPGGIQFQGEIKQL